MLSVGKVGGGYMKKTLIDRFMEKVIPEPNSGCWLWDANTDRDGYGHFKVNGIQHRAHRVSFKVFCEEIPDGMLVCHKCDVRLCVNPNHMFLGTDKDNAQDKIKKNRFGKKSNHISDAMKESIKKETIKAMDIAKKYNIGIRTVRRIRNSSSSL